MVKSRVDLHIFKYKPIAIFSLYGFVGELFYHLVAVHAVWVWLVARGVVVGVQ